MDTNQWQSRFEELPRPSNTLLPSKIQAPKLELKPLTVEPKYAYLGYGETFSVIISSQLNKDQKIKLLETLKEYKGAIEWTIADIKGISPFIYTHKIHLEAQPTHRVNLSIY